MSERWPQLVVTANQADLDDLEAALFDAGANSVTAEDAGDAPVFEPAPGETPIWPRTRLRALFAMDEPIDEVRERLAIRWPALHFEIDRSLVQRDWEREWLRYFRPMRFGRRLWIAPSTSAVKDDDAVVVRLDPGLAFGTGTHPSTAGCLSWLDADPPVGAHVLDYGCGSGILAIAAIRLGARRATCVDIDPQAMVATRGNARRNGVEHAIELVQTPADAAYDVVLANILAGPLLSLAPQLAAFARPGARLQLAGILAGQAEQVAARYSAWFDVSISAIDEEWYAVSGTRKAD